MNHIQKDWLKDVWFEYDEVVEYTSGSSLNWI